MDPGEMVRSACPLMHHDAPGVSAWDVGGRQRAFSMRGLDPQPTNSQEPGHRAIMLRTVRALVKSQGSSTTPRLNCRLLRRNVGLAPSLPSGCEVGPKWGQRGRQPGDAEHHGDRCPLQPCHARRCPMGTALQEPHPGVLRPPHSQVPRDSRTCVSHTPLAARLVAGGDDRRRRR